MDVMIPFNNFILTVAWSVAAIIGWAATSTFLQVPYNRTMVYKNRVRTICLVTVHLCAFTMASISIYLLYTTILYYM